MSFELLTKDEVAKARITRRYLDMRIAAGTGPEVVHIGRRALVRSDAFQVWLEGLTAQSQRKEVSVMDASPVDAAAQEAVTV